MAGVAPQRLILPGEIIPRDKQGLHSCVSAGTCQAPPLVADFFICGRIAGMSWLQTFSCVKSLKKEWMICFNVSDTCEAIDNINAWLQDGELGKLDESLTTCFRAERLCSVTCMAVLSITYKSMNSSP